MRVRWIAAFRPGTAGAFAAAAEKQCKGAADCLVENYRGKGVVMVVGETSGARSGRIVPGRDLTGSEIKENIFEQITVVSCTGNEAKAAGRGSLLQLPCFYHPTPAFSERGMKAAHGRSARPFTFKGIEGLAVRL